MNKSKKCYNKAFSTPNSIHLEKSSGTLHVEIKLSLTSVVRISAGAYDLYLLTYISAHTTQNWTVRVTGTMEMTMGS